MGEKDKSEKGESKKRKVLFLSDAHIGWEMSDFPAYIPDGKYRLRDAENYQRWAGILSYFSRAEHAWNRMPTEKAARIVLDQLKEWNGKQALYVSHNGVHAPLDVDEIKHVFIGHTHLKCDNYAKADGDILFHNTGAIVKHLPKEFGVLEADLENGNITNVRPVEVSKDRDVRSRPRPPGIITR